MVRGLARSMRLFRAFLREQTDPDTFYHLLARDAVGQIRRHTDLDGRLVVDVGGGAGFAAESFRRIGARCVVVDAHYEELFLFGRQPSRALVADGCRLPVRDASADVCHCSNVLEHVPDPWGLLEETIRILRPGGLLYLSFTNWYSPWGGHETSPWHYLGGERAALRYQRRCGQPPKNRYGVNLFPVHIREVWQWLSDHPQVAIAEAVPRYYPSWCRFVLHIPAVREVATWNPAFVLRRV